LETIGFPLFVGREARAEGERRTRTRVLSSPAMRYLQWILAPLVFLFFVTLAVKNTDPVAVRYFLGHEWRAPLIAVVLLFFLIGVILGVLAMLGRSVRQRREIVLLRRELESLREPARNPPLPDLPAP
jgi:lipopolysaccharide assembly protein A